MATRLRATMAVMAQNTDPTTDLNLSPLEVSRAGTGRVHIKNTRGAELTAGDRDAEEAFSPEELLQAALAACSVLSAETQLAYVLGEDFDLTASTAGTQSEDGKRVKDIKVTMNVDMSALGDAEREKLVSRADRIIDRLCVIKRSLRHGVEAATEITSA